MMSIEHSFPSRAEVGPHSVIAEPDAILHLILRGSLNAAQTDELKVLMLAYGRTVGPFDFIGSVAQMEGFDKASRHGWVHAEEPYPFRHCYIVGASFALRTVISGVYRAGRVLRPQYFNWTMDMVATEDDARRLIAQRRA